MKKKAYGLTLAFALLFSAAAGIMLADLAKAELPPLIPDVPAIQVNADGSITPETELISQYGNSYALTADIHGYKILIGCSNIVLDGNGHALILIASADPGANSGIRLSNVKNVTIKNIEIFTSYNAILMYYCSRCHITGVKTSNYIYLLRSDFNTVTESTARIRLMSDILLSTQPNNNLFFRNNLTEIVFSGVKSPVERSNIFYRNNMLLDYSDLHIFPLLNKVNSWDNGSLGNYWSDYLTRYPNASEIRHTGIGDTPYVIDEDNVDYHPLMYPYDIENDAIAFPTPEPQQSPSPEPFPTALVAAASATSAAMIGRGMLIYFKKRHRLKST
jgi:hypothetical protein